jgi:hypothetical protein
MSHEIKTKYTVFRSGLTYSQPTNSFPKGPTINRRYYLETGFFYGLTAPSGPGPSHYRGFTITLRDTPHSVGLLWMGDQPDAETST